MGFGYRGKILRVNLSDMNFEIEEYDDKFYRTYFGGRNLIAYFLLNELDKGVDPLGPNNKLIFANGVLTGSPIGGTGRNSVGAKSPLTGYYGEAEAGGFFGAELKKAGFDAIIVEGKAPKPVYLWINDGNVEIRSAEDIKGLPVAEAHNKLQKELKEKSIRTALIGPGGEKKVSFASILNDIVHAYGRNGMGAVMGSKKLKGIAVRGTDRPDFADEDKVKEIVRWLADNVDKYCGWAKEMGTPGNVMSHNEMHGLPTRNFSSGYFEDAEKISGEAMHSTILFDRDTCYACPVRCKQVVKVEESYEVDPVYGGPEYETLVSFGSMCGVSDLNAVAKANELCNANSLDTITTGGTIAFVMDCFEKGIITEEDTGGLNLKFGNADAMIKLVKQICNREGLGDLLAEGPKKAAEKFGPEAEKLLVDVKGQTVPYHDPRIKQGMALGYAVSPTGADHCHNIFDEFYVPDSFALDEIYSLGVLEPLPMDCFDKRKVRMFTYHVMWKSLLNCLHLCLFMPYSYKQQAEMVEAVTGWNTTTYELAKVGERSINLTRAFNLREGLTKEEDYLPDKLLDIAIGEEDMIVDREDLENAINMYYGMMGWTKDEGRPKKEKLQELNIEWVEELF